MPSTAMSAKNPKLQVAWDSSSLGALQFCPRYYQYTILDGWSGDQTDLQFGGYAAQGFELYQKARLDGKTKDEALLHVVRTMLRITKGWGGEWETMWHCEGTKPYKNKKGHHAKCPYAHKGMWFPGDRPHVCGECGSETSEERRFLPNHPAKNRIGLIRMLIWYIDDQPEDMKEGLHPYIFPDGTKAVELSMRIPMPWFNSYGEQIVLTGHLDYIGVFGDELFPVDNKTTDKTLNDKFFHAYSPHYQLDTYDLMVTMQFPDLPLKGVLIDAAQVLVSGANFGRRVLYKTDEQREEHWHQLKFWIELAEKFALEDRWPMNKRNCWLCPFKQICSRSPEDRQRALETNFQKRPVWDPLVPR